MARNAIATGETGVLEQIIAILEVDTPEDALRVVQQWRNAIFVVFPDGDYKARIGKVGDGLQIKEAADQLWQHIAALPLQSSRPPD